ncbi:MAG: VOC family protein [Promethearchaeota archaeon]
MKSKKKNPLGTNVITQIAIVVNDIEKSSQDFADVFGVAKPAWHRTAPVDESHAEYRGKPTAGRAKLAFFKFKNITLERIEPGENPSTWREVLDERGEGIHHIAFNVKEQDDKIAYFESKGMKLVQKGNFEGGCYAYIDGMEKLKMIIELLS